MKQLSSAQVRQMFLDFFQSKGHTIEPSASLIPVNDPTLLWINSGVATLKKYFDGSVVPEIQESQMPKSLFEQMISKMSVKQHVTIRCLRCWVIFLLVTISKMKPSTGHGNF